MKSSPRSRVLTSRRPWRSRSRTRWLPFATRRARSRTRFAPAEARSLGRDQLAVAQPERLRASAFDLDGQRRLAESNRPFAVALRDETALVESAVLPAEIHLQTAASAQTGDVTLGPGTRQCRQQPDLIFVLRRFETLQEHFGDAAGAAEVAVDLKRRMRVEQVWIGALGTEQQLENAVSALAVAQARP